MAVQICPTCRERFAEVEHQSANGKVSLRVCRACRVPLLLIDHLDTDGYAFWVEVVQAQDTGNRPKIDKAVDKAISAIREASGEETAFLVQAAFRDFLDPSRRRA